MIIGLTRSRIHKDIRPKGLITKEDDPYNFVSHNDIDEVYPIAD
jgi:hypothetical protein